jgi:hypothetical protein
MLHLLLAALPTAVLISFVLWLTWRHDRAKERERNRPVDLDESESFYHKN